MGLLKGLFGVRAILPALLACTATPVASGLAADRPAFFSAGSMKAARTGHTATLLPDGNVLVAGGDIDQGSTELSVSGAELYAPGRSVWTTTGSLHMSRAGHIAVLLPSGTVLVVGGHRRTRDESSLPRLASAEVYNPATQQWAELAPMNTPRDLLAAVLLPNGKVLVAGGYDGRKGLSSAEVYDPVTGKWTLTGSMTTDRIHHTMTLLPNGLVLVCGGFEEKTKYPKGLSTAEVYDPATGTWNRTDGMPTDLADATATLLSNGKVLVAGGTSEGVAWAGAYLFDPAAGKWSRTGSLVKERTFHTAVRARSGEVFVFGGGAPGSTARLSSVEAYDPLAGKWREVGHMGLPRLDATSTELVNGIVLIAGGSNAQMGKLSSAELFDPGAVK